MKNTPLHIEENELDQLLRQFVLDGGPDEFTQNNLNMNADFIFSSPGETMPAIHRETELLRKLERAFVRTTVFSRFWLNGIIFLFLISAAIWMYKSGNGNQPASQHSDPENTTNTFATGTGSDTTENGSDSAAADVKGIFILKEQDSLYADSSQAENPVHPKEHFVTPDSHIPIEADWYAGIYIVPDVAGPVFNAKASPENYKKKEGNFPGRSDGNMMGCKQDSFSAVYYTGMPFKSGMKDFVYFNYAEKAREEHSWGLPCAVIEYADPVDVKNETVKILTNRHSFLYLFKIPQNGIELAMQPFYFRKFEVTNKEYREFLNWVRASNGYANRPIYAVQTDTIDVKNPNDVQNVFTTASGKRYRLYTKSIPTEDYKDVFNYVFFNSNSTAVKALGKNSVYVVNDTLCWVNNFSFSFNEPMSNMYGWHPAYDNYPVVGISWYQAMAFLDWKTHIHQKQLDAENVSYEIEYTLPSDIEWGIASISKMNGNSIEFDTKEQATEDWITDLGISWPGHDDPYQRPNYLKNMFTKNEYYEGDYISDGYFHTGPADLSNGQLIGGKKVTDKEMGTKHLDQLGISWMDGNVSEWMMESYSENWKPFFELHLLTLDADSSESSALAKEIEMLYDKGNAKNGRLVRGANWYDERFSSRPGSLRNEAGISPKRFIDPSEQHCTVGFRYVVHVKKK
ncbi:MAG: SUMF1/EgtB/PvdO family nonheme iron enzyme [Bacteroidia bacterium]